MILFSNIYAAQNDYCLYLCTISLYCIMLIKRKKNAKQQILLMPYHVPKCLCDSTILYMFMYTFFTLRHVKGPNTRA